LKIQIDFFIKSGVELFKEIELNGVDSVYLALDGSKWWACVDMVFDLPVTHSLVYDKPINTSIKTYFDIKPTATCFGL
jgi:hypothetical protein